MNITWRRRFFLLPELCPQRGEPLLERGNDVIADLGLREGDPVYKPTPTIDLIFGANDNLIGIAIHGDEALRLPVCCIRSSVVIAQSPLAASAIEPSPRCAKRHTSTPVLRVG